MPTVARIDNDNRRRRLIARHRLDGSATSMTEVARDLVAIHSSDPVTPFLAGRARIAGASLGDMEHELYRHRSLWRLHAMRRTLWLVPTGLGDRFLAAVTAKIAGSERRRLINAMVTGGSDRTANTGQPGRSGSDMSEISDMLDDFETSVTSLLVAANGDGLTTSELRERVEGFDLTYTGGGGKWSAETPVASRLLLILAMNGNPVRGRPAGTWRSGQYRWFDRQAWFGPEPEPDADSGVDELPAAWLARRWLERFGPAPASDLQWWTGWTKTETTKALTTVGAVAVRTDDGEAWLAPADDPGGEAIGLAATDTLVDPTTVVLLPGLDPTAMGWKDRAWYLTGDHGSDLRLFDRNGNIGPTIWSGGRVVGAWAQRGDGEIRTHLLTEVGSDCRSAVEAEASRLGDWLGDERITIRFPTPLSRSLSA